MKTRNILKTAVAAVLVALAGQSCLRDNTDRYCKPAGSDGDKTVTFAIEVPGPQQATRAMSDTDENTVAEADVLLFDSSGKFVQYAPGYNIEAGTEANKKTFKVNLRIGDGYNLVVLANATMKIHAAADALGGFTAGSTTRQQIFEKLAVANPAGSKLYGTAAPIPMFGMYDNVSINENTDLTDENAVKMVRMVSKIELKLTKKAATGSDDESATGNANFALADVRLYNYSTRGMIVPDLNTAGAWNTSDNTALLPYEPTGGGYARQMYTAGKEPLLYTATDEHASKKEMPNGLYNTIYAYEAPAGSNTGRDNNVCLVVGGYYAGSNKLSYYRVDFRKKSGGQVDYLALLRNHCYLVTIDDVTGPGYNHHDDAYYGETAQIEATIVNWDDGEMNEIQFDGQHTLAVSTSLIEFYKEGNARTLDIYTDRPQGWVVDDNDKPDWLHLTPQSNAAAGKITVSVTADAINEGDGVREGEFWVTAGRLRKQVIVRQMDEPELTLHVYPDMLVFRKSGSTAKSVTVTSYPGDLVRIISSNGDIIWASGQSPDDQSGLKLESYAFKPAVNTQDKILNSIVTIYVEHEGKSIARSVTIKQLATDLLFNAVTTLYPATGGSVSMTVESDAPWAFTKTAQSDPLNMVNLTDVAEHPGNTGEPANYGFELAPSTSYAIRTANLIATSSDPDFPVQEVTIQQAGIAPYLTLTNPAEESDHSLDFGTTPAGQSVNFVTNAGWKYTTDVQFANVVATASAAADVEQTGAAGANQSYAGGVTFTPVNSAATETAAAGSAYSTIITLSTVNPDGAPEATKSVTLKRSAPIRWDGASFQPLSGEVLPRSGASVTVTAATNAAWSVSSTGATTVSQEAATYSATRQQVIAIPNNDSWNTATVTVSAAYTPGGTPVTATYTQAASWMNYISNNIPGTAIPNGGTYNMVFEGDCPDFRVRVYNPTLSSAVWTSTYGNVGTRQVQIPVNSTTERTLEIQYEKNGSWITVKTITQIAQVNITIATPPSYYLMNGNQYSLMIYSNVGWKVDVTSNTDGILHSLDSFSGSGNLSDGQPFTFTLVNDMTLFAISSGHATFTVYPADDIPGAFTPKTVTIKGVSAYHAGNNLYFWTEDLSGGSWYRYANVEEGVNETGAVPPYSGSQVSPARSGSCASLDPNDPTKWRVPSRDEMDRIGQYVVANGGTGAFGLVTNNSSSSPSYYWGSRTLGAYNYQADISGRFTAGTTWVKASIGRDKTQTSHRVRCVYQR